ncbi:MAG: prolipoprotein diacylglyceryl transferase [Deltaproteobacteria bacterium]|nr:prolipoprotein diacylglyceryl transferase [Deltaproteobacteria bacterium]
MRPILFTIGSFRVPSFFFFIMVAILACAFCGYFLCKREKLKTEVAIDFGILGMIFGILGARIFHILVENPAYYWNDPIRVFHFWRGGFVSWGAFIAVPLSLILYLKVRKIPFWPYFDMAAAAMPVIKIFVRIACLMTGCCYGKPTELWWGIRFTNPNSTAFYYYPDLPLHPTQILSLIHAILLFLGINWVYKHRRFEGQTASLMILFWVVPRFFIEFLRGDTDRILFFNDTLSTGQLMGIPLFILGLILYTTLKKKGLHDFA